MSAPNDPTAASTGACSTTALEARPRPATHGRERLETASRADGQGTADLASGWPGVVISRCERGAHKATRRALDESERVANYCKTMRAQAGKFLRIRQDRRGGGR